VSRDLKAGHRLLEQVVGLPITVVATNVTEFSESVAEEITLQIDEEDVGVSALGLLFAVGVLSFKDAAPRGYQYGDFEEDDFFDVGDFLDHLRFLNGCLELRTDYLRGRMMKTDVSVHADGRVTIVTRNRGESATRWVMRLQGKRVLRMVETDGDGT
jgi:hypothetical protein